MPEKLKRMFKHIDDELERRNAFGGVFHKSVFHIHTPASYDYGLFKKEDLNLIKDNQIIELMKEQGLSFINLVEDLDTLLDKNNNYYNDGKELALYCLIANKLVKENIKIALVTDHNTLSGIEKLIYACEFNKKHLGNYVPKILTGVEISCSDKHHVVVILDDKKNSEMVREAEIWMEEYIISKDGTYLPSLLVMEHFLNIGALTYIGHFNTSPMFDEPKFLNGTYKKRLFNLSGMAVIGLSNLNRKKWVEEQISPVYTNRKFNFVLDEDSHVLDELGSKTFWLKGESLNFDMVKNAFEDFENSVIFQEKKDLELYIKALYIEGKGFLKGQKSQDIVVTFSERMTCFIGGRGSGKSTILNTLEFLASQLIDSEVVFDSLMSQGNVCLLCNFKGKDYFISFLNSENQTAKEFKEDYFGYGMHRKVHSEKENRKNILSRIQVWERNGSSIQELTKKKEILDKMFTRKFSISNLVNNASDDEKLNIFISNIIERDDILSKKLKSYVRDNWKSIIKEIDNMENKISNNFEILQNRIDEYNLMNQKTLKTTLRVVQLKEFKLKWQDIILMTKSNYDRRFEGYSILYGGVYQYLEDISEILNPFLVIKMFIEEKYDDLNSVLSLKEYATENSNLILDLNLNEISNSEKLHQLFIRLNRMIKTSSRFIMSEINRYYIEKDIWGLDFNIHNKTGKEQRNAVFKSIQELSMGQKVVAMLNFILSFGEFVGDTSPLIIDQPEDNLDNQYIYKNLVQIFRGLKNNRQIIIASHNSTIVVNSSSELIYVMDSDASHGWIKRKGFSREPKVLTDIINILEGGSEAMKQKLELYGDRIKN
ncbi:AAA family ATPase [Vagococcus fluvialis]|uniref:Spaf_1101 family AAA-like ATPase n=1 Tax=Vagococcus fluvialis TaxID=2738 RepID=UPI001432FED8|nr:AAA family ATPase [Vagococcus fluvialis]NKC59075.1 AAA family ATPase [Vagococcus fluvialis]NKD49830.1 AAA family ATPase [Vagococcus fluvialis]